MLPSSFIILTMPYKRSCESTNPWIRLKLLSVFSFIDHPPSGSSSGANSGAKHFTFVDVSLMSLSHVSSESGDTPSGCSVCRSSRESLIGDEAKQPIFLVVSRSLFDEVLSE